MSKEIPILFSTPMVKAILDGRKTMTRRVAKIKSGKWKLSFEANEPNRTDLDAFGVNDENGNLVEYEEGMPGTLKELNLCKWQVGDVLWVRETCGKDKDGNVFYKADGVNCLNWTPSIFMPKWVCRIWLEVTEVRVEKLQSISYNDAVNEGLEKDWDGTHHWFKNYLDQKNIDSRAWSRSPITSFKSLWESINGNWDENPFVWVISFKILSTTGKP